MSLPTATAPTFRVGQVVAARPWRDGAELPVEPGFVVWPEFGNEREYAIVLFPRRERDADTVVVQAILRTKMLPNELPSKAFAKRGVAVAVRLRGDGNPTSAEFMESLRAKARR